MDWNKVLPWILGLAGLLFGGIFAYSKAKDAEEEKLAKIAAQNEVARLSKTVRETNDTWSRLSEQQANLAERVNEQNEALASVIENQREQVLAVSSAVAKMAKIQIRIERDNISQEELPNNRTRVSFEHNHRDYLRVRGFSLTNPPETEMSLEFTRPLRLSTTVTRREDGSWHTYVTATNWPDLQIENIETQVDPGVISEPEAHWYENILVGTSIGTSLSLSSYNQSLYFGYRLGDVAFGPSLNLSVHDGGVAFNQVGAFIQIFPF